MASVQQVFRKVLSLVGHDVEVATHSEAKPVKGTITNAMFDSLLLQAGEKTRVIRFVDIVYLVPA